MTNAFCVVLYLSLMIAAVILLVSGLNPKRKGPLKRPFFAFVVCLLGWLVFEILYFLLPTEAGVAYVMDAKLVFVALAAPSMLLMVARFYRLEKLFTPTWVASLFAIPVITAALSLCSPIHSLITTHFEVTTFYPLTLNIMERGAWYYVHSVYSYGMYIGAAIIVLVANRNLPSAYKAGSQFMYISVFLFLGCTCIETFMLDGHSPLDFTLIGASLAAITFYLASYAQGSKDYLSIRKSEVFNYLDQAIFILNDNGYMVDANHPAMRLLEILGRPGLAYIPYNQFLAELIKEGRLQRRQVDNSQSYDLVMLNTTYPIIYSVHTQPFFAYGGEVGGRLVIMDDVTNSRLFVDRLRETAGVDALTGLLNRFGYQEALRQMDVPENLPLSIIIGDVDNLKTINDRFGHYEGDLLLKAVADILRNGCPSNGAVARIGGDEFMMLLPQYSRQQATEVMYHIRNRMALSGSDSLQTGLALGCATKTRPDENMNKLIAEADRRMYSDKGTA